MAHRIKKCLIGARYTEEIIELNHLGIETIPLSHNPHLDDEICNHADILAFNFLGEKLFADSRIAGEMQQISNDIPIIFCDTIKSPYPHDVGLNVALLGNKLICNTKTVFEEILKYAKQKNLQILDTKQGYTKCNLCLLNENAVITEDKGLSSLLKKYQIDVLTIQSGYVGLSDKHYGFIGGAGARLSDNEIYFSGNISAHPDYDDITQFLYKYDFTAIYNKNRPLKDFGGFIAID